MATMCYFCEEEIEFSMPSQAYLDALEDKGANSKPQWRHVDTKLAACRCYAAPSNIMIEG